MSRRLTGALIALALAVLLLGSMLAGQRRQTRLYTASWWDLFDTVTIVTGYADSQAEWDAQIEALHDDLLAYHRLFDIYNHYDGLTNAADLNAEAGAGPVTVSAQLLDLLIFGQQAYTLTDGACNIAAGRVLALWHDARVAAETAETATAALLPTQAALEEAAAHCGMEGLVLDEEASTVAFADPELQLDLGSIAKGYAVEAAAQAAEARGMESALLNVGGNVRAIGKKPDGSPWTAGVDNPRPADTGENALLASVRLEPGQCLVVSGDYQRYFTVDGVRYHHLIDLKTLQPARYFSSVAVLCSDSGLGDALSTGLFCMPLEEGQTLVGQLDGVSVLWVLADGSTVASDGWAGQEIQN